MPFKFLVLLTTACLIVSTNSIGITIINSTNSLSVSDSNGEIFPQFIAVHQRLGCMMPKLYIYNDTGHERYQILTRGVRIISVTGKYLPISYELQCEEGNPPNCAAYVTNGCYGSGKNLMNWIIVSLANAEYSSFEYLVNCKPSQFYKPFEWGLFILICFCTITITASSLYSRAWSYKGFGINVTKTYIIIFNCVVIVASILAYYFPNVTSVTLQVVGSLIGTAGVTICASESLWLVKNRKLNQARISVIRLLDIVSLLIGICLTGIYWLSDGMWIVNDVLAVCTIIACIKILKVRSLKNGIFMLFSLLIIQIIAGLIVHYVLKTSYNNLVIQMFESPLVIVFPSITPQFYRKCAWLPVTNIIFPGLFISYLRRFDKSRGTFLYLLIGYGSFYIGSILWMIVDMNTKHALPLAIISDPITIITISIFAIRRNQLRTIWHGFFYDAEMPDTAQDLLPATKSGHYIAFQDITEDLKIDKHRDDNDLTEKINVGQI